MRRLSKAGVIAAAAGLIVAVGPTLSANASLVQNASGANAIAGVKVPLTYAGSASFGGGTVSVDPATDTTEFDPWMLADVDAQGGGGDDENHGLGRTLTNVTKGNGHAVKAGIRSKSKPTLGTSFEGLNFNNQRFANGGNQFSVEPPDQALCAGNGFVVEALNDVFRAYHADGTAATSVIDLNTFYGYIPAIKRTAPNLGQRGPSITDPVCLYDAPSGRFILTVLTLDHVGTTASLNGNNHLDIAVSNSSDPTAGWTVYKLPVQNNGTDGTPNHHCNSGFCLGDYPHIGADANGIYLTTNEFAFSGPGFYGAQVYEISKSALLSGGPSIPAVLFNTLGAGPDGAGFTVWPATVPGGVYHGGHNGSEFFLSSDAVFTDDGTSGQILLWTMANTGSINNLLASQPYMTLQTIPVATYAVPPWAEQKAGSRPLSECIADTVVHPTCNVTVAGIGSHNNSTFGPPNGALNANDSRMQQVMFANGKVWGALDTDVVVNGEDRAGIAYYVINPESGKLVLQGQAGLDGTDMGYPAVGVTDSGRGIIAFTLSGENDYPSAAYASFDAKVGMGPVQIAAAGAGPWDGFTSYVAFGSGRPRWGDYGATSVTGNTIWAASEYIAQTCSYTTYFSDPTCGGTRGALSNWSTRISAITP